MRQDVQKIETCTCFSKATHKLEDNKHNQTYPVSLLYIGHQ